MKNARPKISLLTLLIILAVLLSGIYFAGRSGTNPNAYGNDFNVYYFAAREIANGHTPYDQSLGAWTPYLYLPLLAELLIPLTWLPLSIASYVWFLISAFSLLVAMRMAALLAEKELRPSPSGESRQTQILRPHTLLLILALITLVRFTLDNFDYGQVNTIVAALGVAHIYFYANNKKPASMIAFALAATIKLTPLVFIAYHLAKGRWKFAVACAALFVALTAASYAPFGSRADDAFTTFFKRTVQNEQGFNFAYHGNQSLRAAIERIKGNEEAIDPSSRLTTVSGAVLLLLALFVALRTQSEIAASAPFFCLAVILSPLSWKQHFVILILPLAFLIRAALIEKDKPRKILLFSLLALVFALFNLTSPKLIGVAVAEWCDAHSLIFIGAMMLYAGSIMCAWQSSSSATRPFKNSHLPTSRKFWSSG
jgi:alpha-1,2-mannosyltransferase